MIFEILQCSEFDDEFGAQNMVSYSYFVSFQRLMRYFNWADPLIFA